MSKPRTGIYKDGIQQEVDPSSLPEASSLEIGGVKQGASEVCFVEQNSKYEEIDGVYYPNFDKRYNDAIKSRRSAGQIQNTEFVVIRDFNAENVDYDAADDSRVFHAGDTTTLKMSGKYIPKKYGFVFKGWALTPDAVVPIYPYDEGDPQDYTLTFVDDDITLYGVWEEEQAPTYTVTYSLGEYGQGSVPAAQTVEEGETVYLSFSPAPTVNDGSGRVFVGWATEDGYDTYNAAPYKQDGITSFTPYADVTLYPVFCAQYTLTYALGNDATGSVPSAVTGYNGESVPVTFSPAPTCVSDPTKSFLGWNTVDEQSSATYQVGGMMNFVYMTGNVTLYPAFGVIQTRTLTYMLGDYGTGSVPSPTTGTDIMGMGTQYVLSFSPAPTCTRAGNNWTFTGWSQTDGETSHPQYPIGTYSAMKTPAGDMTLYPVFEEVDGSFTITNNTDEIAVNVYDGEGYIGQVTEGNTMSFNFSASKYYNIMAHDNVAARFTGTYQGTEYEGEEVTVQYDDDENEYILMSLDNNGADWTFQSGDGGTFTVNDL